MATSSPEKLPNQLPHFLEVFTELKDRPVRVLSTAGTAAFAAWNANVKKTLKECGLEPFSAAVKPHSPLYTLSLPGGSVQERVRCGDTKDSSLCDAVKNLCAIYGSPFIDTITEYTNDTNLVTQFSELAQRIQHGAPDAELKGLEGTLIDIGLEKNTLPIGAFSRSEYSPNGRTGMRTYNQQELAEAFLKRQLYKYKKLQYWSRDAKNLLETCHSLLPNASKQPLLAIAGAQFAESVITQATENLAADNQRAFLDNVASFGRRNDDISEILTTMRKEYPRECSVRIYMANTTTGQRKIQRLPLSQALRISFTDLRNRLTCPTSKKGFFGDNTNPLYYENDPQAAISLTQAIAHNLDLALLFIADKRVVWDETELGGSALASTVDFNPDSE